MLAGTGAARPRYPYPILSDFRARLRGNGRRPVGWASASFQFGQPFAHVAQLIRDQQGSHQEETFVADLAEFDGEPVSAVADKRRKLDQACFFALAAAQTIRPAVHRYRDLPHLACRPPGKPSVNMCYSPITL